MLPKINRLTKKKDFESVFKKGESVRNLFLLCKMAKSNLPQSRFGFVVSKKISSKATVRNTVKRRMRDAVAGALEELKKPVDMVIVALPGIELREFTEIKGALLGAFKKLKAV